jgi:NAD-dependent dihydropyrimidine dehydrogenase PreA subunit
VCTGCGLCEKACIAVEPAITVKASRGGQPSARRRA